MSIDDGAPELVWLDSAGLELFASDRAPVPPPEVAAAAPAASSAASPATAWTDVTLQPSLAAVSAVGRHLGGRGETSGDWIRSAVRAAVVCVAVAVAADMFFVPEEAPERLASMSAMAAPAAPPEAATPPAAMPPAEAVLAPAPAAPALVDAPAAVSTERRLPAPPRRAPVARDPEERPRPAIRAQRAAAVTAPSAAPVGAAPIARPDPPAPDAVPAAMTAVLAVGTPPPAVPAVAVADAPPVVTAPAETRPAPTAASAAPAAPPPPARPAAVSSAELETRAIEAVLGRYRTAFNALDAGAASAVWPSVNEKNLARAFERLADQTVSFDQCRIEVAAVLAEAACDGSARYVPKVGNRTPKAESRRWTFSLRKAGSGWLIDRVDAR